LSKKDNNNCRCNLCSKEVKSEKALIKHYRKKHPNDAINLFGAIGTTGDKFSDKALSQLSKGSEHNKLRASTCELELSGLKVSYNKLNFKYQQLANANNAIGAIMANASAAVNTPD
jgi:hypothetical protein